MWLLFYLLIWTISVGSNTDKDISSVYSLDEYNGFFNTAISLKYELHIGLLGFKDDFSENELRILLSKYVGSVQPKIISSHQSLLSRVIYGIDYNVIRLDYKFLKRYMSTMKDIMNEQYQQNKDVTINPKVYSDYVININKHGLVNLMNDIYENCSILKIENLYIVIEKAPSGNAHDPSGCISIIFIKPTKAKMVPNKDPNADRYFYRYFYSNDNENSISTYYISDNRYIFVDVTAGPIVVSTDSDSSSIHNLIPYEFSYDHTMKLNTVALQTKQLIENIIFPNIMNLTFIPHERQLLLPVVFFTKEDPYSPRVSNLIQEIEEVKMQIRTIFKTHIKTRRLYIVTETIYLQNNISLQNAIRSTFINSISLMNQNNSIHYHIYQRIDGEQLSIVLQNALRSRPWLFSSHRLPDSTDSNNMFPIFVLDVGSMKVMFEDYRPYYCNNNNIIVVRSEATFPPSFTTDPNFKAIDNYGNSTKNFISSAIFEGIIGIENFKHVSSSSENQFMLAIGNHPFQYNNEVSYGKLYSYTYQRHRLVLLINSIIDEIESSFHCINNDIYSIIGNPVRNETIVITREYLSDYFKGPFTKQPAQFQKLFQDIVSLCNQFSFYIDSFMDIDFSSLKQDSQGDLLELYQLLHGVKQFQELSKRLMNEYVSIAQCSEIKHIVLYSTDISLEWLLVAICIICLVVFLVVKYIFL